MENSTRGHVADRSKAESADSISPHAGLSVFEYDFVALLLFQITTAGRTIPSARSRGVMPTGSSIFAARSALNSSAKGIHTADASKNLRASRTLKRWTFHLPSYQATTFRVQALRVCLLLRPLPPGDPSRSAGNLCHSGYFLWLIKQLS